MRKLALPVLVVSVAAAASARADAAPDQVDDPAADAASTDATASMDRRAARAYGVIPFGVSPRAADQAVTGDFWGGYDGGARGPVGEAVIDGRVSRLLSLTVGASSSDLSGRSTAILGARLGLLRDGAAPFDLGVGLFFQPQSIRGDGLVTGTVSLGKTVGRLSSQATFGYGQDPEGDDGLGVTSLGGVFRVTERVQAGLASRARVQLWSNDRKFSMLEQPVMDFTAGPLLAYSLGCFDIIAQGGLAGLMLKMPPDAIGDHTRFQLGPLVMLGVGATL